MSTSAYTAREQLHNGRLIEIRALRPSDENGMLDALDQTNAESLRRRFFVTKRAFSDTEKAFFMNVDFVKHVALVAEIEEAGRRSIVGGGRYIVTAPGEAEIAFVVIDAYRAKELGPFCCAIWRTSRGTLEYRSFRPMCCPRTRRCGRS